MIMQDLIDPYLYIFGITNFVEKRMSEVIEKCGVVCLHHLFHVS